MSVRRHTMLCLLAAACSAGCQPGYASRYAISMTSTGETVETRLTFDAGVEFAPSFSPDGRAITYSRTDMIDGRPVSKFWTIDVDGRHARRVTTTANELAEWTPVWHPDGRRLIWCSDRSGNLDIWALDQSRQQYRQLTTSAAADNFPIWRPDGRQIAFMSERDGESAVWLMDPDGVNQRRVSRRETGDLGVSWSRDGNRLVYVAALHTDAAFHTGAWIIQHGEPPENGAIVVQELRSGADRQITSGRWRDWYPMWNPVNDTIAYVSNESGNWDIWLMNSDGSHRVQLTTNPGKDTEPSWSPDGRSLTYVSERNGQWDVWLMDVEQTLAGRAAPTTHS